MSLDLALSIARSGLSHVNRQLAQSASNVANAATPGYTRKVVQGEASVAGSLASGVRSAEATRAVDTALVTQMNAARATTEAAAARVRILEGVEVAHGAMGESVADLTAALGDAFVALRNDPSDTLLQGGVTDAAGTLAARYNTVSTAIQAARQAAQDGMEEDVAALNGALRQVSELTDQILPLRAQGMSTVELEDKRDQAIATISSIMQVRAVSQADGGMVLISSGGLNLPLHAEKGPFSIGAAIIGAESYHGASGTLPGVMLGGADVTVRLGNGTLGAYASLRDAELPLAQAELDVSAANLAARFDAQGLTLFTGSAGTVPDPTASYSTSGWIGLAGALRVNSAVRADPSLVRDGTHAVTGSAGGPTAFTPNGATGPADFTTLLDRVLNQTFGTEVSAGNPQPGFTTTGLGPDGSLSSTLRSGRSLEDHAGRLVATQTAARAGAEEEGASSGDLLSSIESRFAERSGVDMDTELAAMVTLQTAYAANARLVSVVQSMYDTLFQAVR
ncbi:MAG TPA: flagellar basal body rod C-terminal domain-containing protein [Roseomonas sp.]